MMKASAPFTDNGARTDLLDELARLSHCDFLSNLLQHRHRASLHRALRVIHPQAFTEKAWIDAATYLCEGEGPFVTMAQARACLLKVTAK